MTLAQASKPVWTGKFDVLEQSSLSQSAAENFATEGYIKLLLQSRDLYNIISVEDEHINIWQDGIEHIVSIKRIASVPDTEEA